MKLDKQDVARLLEGVPAPHEVGWWPVAESYRIHHGSIYADNPEPIWMKDFEKSLETDQFFANPDLFLSFARLGARGEPSEKSILQWVAKHGLLERANEKDGALRRDTRRNDIVVDQAPITVARFRAEVLCAYQLLTLYTDIQEENVGALEAHIYGSDGTRHSSSYWPNTPSTELEDFFTTNRDIYAEAREGMRLIYESRTEAIGSEEAEGLNLKNWDPWAALWAVHNVVENRIADVRLSFDKSYLGPLFLFSPRSTSDYKVPRSWYCPDLLSTMYLQFYLVITDFEPLRRCQNPACGLPFPATRKNKRFCNATCRSNARNYR